MSRAWFLAGALAAGAAAVAAVPVDQEPAHHQVLDNAYVRAFEVTVAPKAATLLHRHDRDYVFVTLGDSEVVNEKEGAAPVTLALKDGEVRYVRGGFAHLARNLSDRPFHNVTIELKDPGTGVCGIGDLPACTAPQVFATEHISARVVALDPGQKTPAHAHATPHMAVAIDDIVLKDSREGAAVREIPLRPGQVVWIGETGFTHTIQNAGPKRARLLSIEVK